MACEARSGLKLFALQAGHSSPLYVGMACEARSGLKLSPGTPSTVMATVLEWPVKPVRD